jgi:hypothetical protein
MFRKCNIFYPASEYLFLSFVVDKRKTLGKRPRTYSINARPKRGTCVTCEWFEL